MGEIETKVVKGVRCSRCGFFEPLEEPKLFAPIRKHKFAKRFKWTPEQDAELKHYIQLNKSKRHIAKMMGRTYQSIGTRIWILNGGKRLRDKK